MLVRLRAHWGVWKALAMCLAIDAIRLGCPTMDRVVKRTVIILPIVAGLLLLPSLDTGRGGAMPPVQELLLLSPQSWSLALPLAYFVALLLEPESVPPRRLIPMVLGMSIVCTIVLAFVTMSVIPRTNAAYRNVVFERLNDPSSADRSGVTAGPGEWTFTELVRKSVGGGWSDAEVLRARATLNMRLIVSTLPIMLGFVGLALSGAPSPKIALFNAVWLLILYVAVGLALAPSRSSGPSAASLWLINALFSLAAICVTLRRPGGLSEDRTLFP